MTRRPAHRPRRTLPALLAAVGLGLAAACSSEKPAGPVAPTLPPPFADTLPELPPGGFAYGWDGTGEPVVVRRERLPEGYRVETVVTGLADPVGLAFLPDGRALAGEQHTGRIRVVEGGALRDEPFAVVPDVAREDLELGLLGIAVDPQFAANRWVYAFYVEADSAGEPARSVLVRFTERDGAGVERTELASFPATATDKHNGGGLKFGPDGKLYLTIGDTDRRADAADPGEPVGKVLRLNRDGSAPKDNPLVSDERADPRVFAYGFRNLFGFAFHPSLPGRLIATDNGITGFDEINIVRPGSNYGWPEVLAFSERAGTEDPVWAYVDSVAPAGMEAYTGDRLPEFRGDVFFCQFLRGGLHRLRFSDDFRRVESDTVIATGCATSVAQGPDGLLYFAYLDPKRPRGGRLLRIVGP